MIEKRTVNNFPILYVAASKATHSVEAAYLEGNTVKGIAQATVASIALNFNYADTVKGIPIGRLIVDGKEVIKDIPKTVARDELYALSDGTLRIGKAPSNAKWAIQGSPRLITNGVGVTYDSVKRDQLGTDIWTGKSYRTAVGLTASNELIIVRTLSEIHLHDLESIMRTLKCVDALNGDGGGSSYMWPEDNGWGRKLGSALILKGVKKMAKKFVVLSGGHGMETAGKRTPLFDDGTFMHENEFNDSVVARVITKLKARYDVDVADAAPGSTDVPLEKRTAFANNETKNGFGRPADLYFSIHANAAGGVWGKGGRGIEVLYYPSVKSKAAAEIALKHLLKGTALPNRGIKERSDLWELRKTTMPAVLAECGFMDDLAEAYLLKSDKYREECAEEITEAIAEILTLPKLQVVVKPADSITAIVYGKEIEGARIIDGVTLLPLRAVGEAIGAKVSWDAATKTARLDKEVK